MKEETPANQRLLMAFLADIGCALLIYHGHNALSTNWGKAQFIGGIVGMLLSLIGLVQFFRAKYK